jgi:hypothetical protein
MGDRRIDCAATETGLGIHRSSGIVHTEPGRRNAPRSICANAAHHRTSD